MHDLEYHSTYTQMT